MAGYIAIADLFLDPYKIWAIFASDPVTFITVLGILVVRTLMPKPITLILFAVVAVIAWWLDSWLTKEP